MAIDVQCPFCDKPYKLKDELAGKRVTCANRDCRKVFTVSAPANSSANGPPPSASPPPDAESLAIAALIEDEAPPPEDTRTIDMTCTSCDYQWTVPWAMQGKNVLCPDCKTRQRVPEQKKAGKADWRDRRQPTLAKIERLEGVVASQDTTFITGETIQKAGLVEVEYEPRPVSFYVKIALPILALLIVTVGLVVYTLQSRTQQRQDTLVSNFIEAVNSPEMQKLPPAVAPLYRATLLLAAGEHDARFPDQDHRDRAIKHFSEARAELDKAQRSAERDALLGELAVALLILGGNQEQVKAHVKLPWVPQPRTDSRARIKGNAAEEEGVQRQIARVFEVMRGLVDFDYRAATARRLARELVRHDQVQMLLDTLPAGFIDAEQHEVRGQIGLELLRAGHAAKAREVAESLKVVLTNKQVLEAASPTPASAQALWLALDPPVEGTPTIAAAPSGGEVSDASRLAYTALYMVQKKPDEALRLARQPGRGEGRVKALALAAEWAEQPRPFAEAAAEIVEAEWKKDETVRSLPSGQAMIRLARSAVRGGIPEKADVFIQPILDEGLREWAKAEVLREKLRANPSHEGQDEQAAVPDTVKKYRLGHAWGRLHLARHNASRTGDRSLAATYAAAWPPIFAPFGQAGVALGVLDAERK
jgi:hypothetical protein